MSVIRHLFCIRWKVTEALVYISASYISKSMSDGVKSVIIQDAKIDYIFSLSNCGGIIQPFTYCYCQMSYHIKPFIEIKQTLGLLKQQRNTAFWMCLLHLVKGPLHWWNMVSKYIQDNAVAVADADNDPDENLCCTQHTGHFIKHCHFNCWHFKDCFKKTFLFSSGSI